jgi:hypothetical protein
MSGELGWLCHFLLLAMCLGCGAPHYSYFLSTKGGAQRFPKGLVYRRAQASSNGGSAPDAGAPVKVHSER